MNATNPNQEIDTLKITENSNGSYTMDWDKNDPKWSWMNNLTNEQVSIIVQQAIQEELKDHG